MALTKKIQKLLKWLVPSFILLLLASFITVWLLIPSFLSNKISEYARDKSGGEYTLSIGDIRRGLFPLSVTFSDVSLEPALENHSGEEGIILNYSFSVGKIAMNDINLRRLLTKNTFSCREMKIVRPAIKLEGEELMQVDSLNISEGRIAGLWPLFGFVEEIFIRKIHFEEANFGFYSAAGDSNFISQAEKVSIDILGFYANSAMASNGTSLFQTDDILIRMNHFSIDMGDSLHVSTIDTLLYSLKTTDIKIKNFLMYPFRLNPEHNLFEVKVPEVYIKSRSITHFALSDSIKIRFVEFLHPNIRFYQKSNPEQLRMEDINQFDLYSLVQNQLIKLEVDTFYLQDAHMEIFRQPFTDNYRQQLRSVDVTLYGFALDSSSSVNPEKMFHADWLKMQVAGYHLKLEDIEHHFRAESLYVSTISSQLSAKNISIQPENEGAADIRTFIDIECRKLNIEDLNFLKLYHGRILPASKIELVEPDVHLLYRLDKVKQQKKPGSGLLFEVVTEYMEGVYAENVFIENGKLDIRNLEKEALKGYFETRFDFQLSDFRLDSSSVERSSNFFFASGFELQFSEYSMRLIDDFHKLNVERVGISSLNGHVQIENLELQPVVENITADIMRNMNRSELFRISVPNISLRNVDLNNAFFHKKLSISQFNISNPKIYFENFSSLRTETGRQEFSEIYQLLFNYVEDIDIRRFSTEGGVLTWINHTRQGETTSFDNEFSASLENFRLNQAELEKRRLLFSENFEVSIKDQEFELSDNVHVLKGSEIIFSSAQSMIKVKNALLFPLISSERYAELPTTFQVAIPEISIEGFNFQKAFDSQEPEIRLLEIKRPRLQVYMQAEEAKWLDSKSYQFPLPSFIESVKVNELKITGAQAISYKVQGFRHSARANFFFDLSLPELVLKNDDQNQMQLLTDNVWVSISDFKTPIDDIHNLVIGSIEFNRNNKTIQVSDLEMKPFIATTIQNNFIIKAPEINFTGFDFDAAINNSNFIFNQIEARRPGISIFINQEIKDDTIDFLQTLDLYPSVEHLVNQVQVNRLDIRDVDLQIQWDQKQFKNENIDLSFSDILLSENQPTQNLFNSREFQISTTGLSTRSKDGMYEYSADSLIYNSAAQKVRLKNINMRPLIPRERFPLLDGYQRDVTNVNIAYAELRGVDERKWIQEQILDANFLEIGPLKAEIYRNKRFPFNHNQRPVWPQDLIKNLNQEFTFDSVKLLPSNIRYSELMGISDEPGYIEFNRLTLSGGTFSNIEKINRQRGPFTMDAEAFLYNQAKLSVQFSFNLFDEQNRHTARGFLEPMQLDVLNHIIKKSEPIAIEEGKLNRLEFELSFNSRHAEGELYAGYNDLKIAVLNFSGEEIQKDRFTSFLANKLKVNSQSHGTEPVKIMHERDEERSLISFWWKSIYSGIKSVIGI
jgi:hypothetical protein